jgi:spermidine/putrescine transport system substrate-binding protein
MRSLLSEEITRRAALKRAGVVGAAAVAPSLLAACGGSTDETEEESENKNAGKVGGTLSFLSWQGYDLPDEMVPWLKRQGGKLRTSYIATHDDIQAKVKQNRPGTYDLISYYQGYHDLYRELEVISEFDRGSVPRYEDNYDMFKGQPDGKTWWEDGGSLYGVPFTFGTWVLNYNPKQVEEPRRWRDLLDPKLKNRVAILDDPNGAIVIGARILDLPVPRLTQSHLDQIIDFWRDVRENSRTIAASPGDLVNLFVSGEVVAAFSYSAITALSALEGVKIGFTVPAEGAASFVDAWAIPPGSDNRATSLAWMDQTLTPQVQAYQAKSLSAGVVQPSAVSALGRQERDLFPYEDLDGWFQQAPLFDLPPQNEEGIVDYAGWLETWSNFRSESG